MAGLSMLLETARRALMSQQIGMSVTSHNIANASTPGYSRQRADLVPSVPLPASFGFLGTGVMVEHVGRMRDRFIDQQIRVSNQTMGSADARRTILSQIEANLNEPSEAGLSSVMTKFFNSFQDLAVHPEESSTRNAVLQQGKLLAQSFHQLSTEMGQLRTSLSDDVNVKVARINALSQEISSLDVQITNGIAVGGDPSDAKDQRDIKLEELSKLANISVSEDAKGSIMVAIGGTVIASRAGATLLKADPIGNQITILTDPDGHKVNLNAGELGGILETYNTTIPGYLDRLNQLAGAIITRVNAVHASGFGLGTPPSTGINFFSGTNAIDIGVDPTVDGNINAIAASADGTPGNNAIALALSGIVGEPLLNGNTLSPAQFYNGLVSQIGSDITGTDSTARSQELVLAQLENQRASTSGVSIDEEMTNLIKFQRGFDAAARVITTANAMFDTILRMV